MCIFEYLHSLNLPPPHLIHRICCCWCYRQCFLISVAYHCHAAPIPNHLSLLHSHFLWGLGNAYVHFPLLLGSWLSMVTLPTYTHCKSLHLLPTHQIPSPNADIRWMYIYWLISLCDYKQCQKDIHLFSHSAWHCFPISSHFWGQRGNRIMGSLQEAKERIGLECWMCIALKFTFYS